MKCGLMIAVAVAMAFATTAETKVETTMSVARCQAVLKNGSQCGNQASKGEKFCWRHRGAAKAVQDTLDDASAGAGKAWGSTKQWSTNAWNSTKSGAKEAWQATKDAFEDARKGFNEMVGGKERKSAPAK